jgi:hypothetical protein
MNMTREEWQLSVDIKHEAISDQYFRDCDDFYDQEEKAQEAFYTDHLMVECSKFTVLTEAERNCPDIPF